VELAAPEVPGVDVPVVGGIAFPDVAEGAVLRRALGRRPCSPHQLLGVGRVGRRLRALSRRWTGSSTLKIFKDSRLKKSLKVGIVACNGKKTYAWRCTLAAARYTIRVYATDIAGNVQSKVGSARLTVR
jgi:hypothetical protein